MEAPGQIVGGQADFERWETFWVNGQRVGALRRVWRYSVLLTRIAIERDDEPYLAESRIRFVPGPDWDLSWFHDSGMAEPVLLQNPASWTSTGSMPLVTPLPVPARDGGRLRAGTTGTVPAGTLPGYGAFLVLQHLVATGLDAASWTAVADRNAASTGETRLGLVTGAPVPDFVAVLSGGDGILRYDRTVGGRLRASHWVREGTVVASDWLGAHSLLVNDDAGTAAWECIAGLQDGSAQFLLHGHG